MVRRKIKMQNAKIKITIQKAKKARQSFMHLCFKKPVQGILIFDM